MFEVSFYRKGRTIITWSFLVSVKFYKEKKIQLIIVVDFYLRIRMQRVRHVLEPCPKGFVQLILYNYHP